LAKPVTHNPISAWYRRASDLFREQPVQRHERLVINETTLPIEKPREDWPEEVDKDAGDHLEELFLWAAIDPDTQQLVHVTVTTGRSGVDALAFVKGVLARCDNQPAIHVDRGAWYPLALGFAGLGLAGYQRRGSQQGGDLVRRVEGAHRSVPPALAGQRFERGGAGVG